MDVLRCFIVFLGVLDAMSPYKLGMQSYNWRQNRIWEPYLNRISMVIIGGVLDFGLRINEALIYRYVAHGVWST